MKDGEGYQRSCEEIPSDGGRGCGEGIVFSNEIKRRENDFD